MLQKLENYIVDVSGCCCHDDTVPLKSFLAPVVCYKIRNFIYEECCHSVLPTVTLYLTNYCKCVTSELLLLIYSVLLFVKKNFVILTNCKFSN